MPINREILQVIRQDREKAEFLFPYYGKFSIAEIGPTILDLFGVAEGRAAFPFPEFQEAKNPNQKVIFLLIDGLAYHHFLYHRHNFSFFRRLTRQGEVYPITSVFPSTTAAGLTTIHSGLTPQEHGLPEWRVFFEEFDMTIETLRFKGVDMADTDELVKHGGSYRMLYEGETIFSKLKSKGVPSFSFVAAANIDSLYTKTTHYGSTLVGSSSGEELVDSISKKIESHKGPGYFYIYWAPVDHSAHKFGPESLEHVTSISYICALMEDLLTQLREYDIKDTLFMVAADHGHSNIRTEDIINLNIYPVIKESFQVGKNGKQILPTGSPHDVFLHIQPDKVQGVLAFLEKELEGKAWVLSIQSAIHQGLFGLNEPTQKFLRRVGNVLILPHSGYHVWYEFLPEKPWSQLGIHGGLSEEEMLVPLAVAKLSDLVGP